MLPLPWPSARATVTRRPKGNQSRLSRLHKEPWGDVLSALLNELPDAVKSTAELVNCAKRLDKHYIATAAIQQISVSMVNDR